MGVPLKNIPTVHKPWAPLSKGHEQDKSSLRVISVRVKKILEETLNHN